MSVLRKHDPDSKLYYQDLLKNLRRISKTGLSYVIQQLTVRRQEYGIPPSPTTVTWDTGDGKGATATRSSASAPGTSGGGAAAQDQKKGRLALPPNMEPTYYIGGYNGTAMIDVILSSGLGWRRTKDKLDETYKFKWCELKSAINYHSFKEGEQIVNHIPNCQLLTNKLGLLNSLQEYDRVCATVKRRVPKLDFIPETFRLSEHKHRETFLQQYQEGEVWICKPTARNQGKGIYLVRNIEEVRQIVQVHDNWNEQCAQRGKPKQSLNRIIQRYITNPLLLNGKKFDIRAYMLIACMTPYLVLYHKGYVRLSIHDYDTSCDNLIAHLTNQFIQKKDPTYKQVKEDTTWSMDKFNEYINTNVASKKGLEANWVYHTFTNRVKQIMSYCFTAVKHKLQSKTGYFDLYGFDFMIDEDMKVWLIEVNVNPCLATNCKALADVVPSVVRETIHVTVECFEKARRSKPLFPLKALQNFEILFSDSPRVGVVNPPRSITAQQLVPTSDFRARISTSPQRQTSSKDEASSQQKSPEPESKTPSAKPHQGASVTKETTSTRKGKLTASQEADNQDDDGDSKKLTPATSDGNRASDDSNSKKVSSEKSTPDDVDLKKTSPAKAAESGPTAGSASKKDSPANSTENHVARESDSKKVSPANSAETHVSGDVDSKKVSPAKSAENHASDESKSKKISPTKSVENRVSDDSASKKISPAKSAGNSALDSTNSKKKKSAENNSTDDGDSKKVSPANPAENHACHDSDSKEATPAKSTENHALGDSGSTKARAAESNSNKPLLSSTSEPNSQIVSTEAVKKPPSGRKSAHRLPNLPTPAPPLVSGIERLQKSPYAEPVLLKMTHSTSAEHRKGKGARLDGKQSRGS